MVAEEQRIDAISNDLANINTPGYKSQRPDFSDLLYQQVPTGNAVAAGVGIGNGARVAGMTRDESEGSLQQTGSPTDLAIDGAGFFAVQQPDGTTAYTRNGSFVLDANGQLVDASGDRVTPPIRMPQGASNLTIGADGRVTATLANGQIGQLGRIQVAVFANPDGLTEVGNSLLVPSANSGRAQLVNAGTNGSGQIQQGTLEQAQVDLGEEMSSLIEAERAFQMLSKVITTADQMAQMGNNLRGG